MTDLKKYWAHFLWDIQGDKGESPLKTRAEKNTYTLGLGIVFNVLGIVALLAGWPILGLAFAGAGAYKGYIWYKTKDKA